MKAPSESELAEQILAQSSRQVWLLNVILNNWDSLLAIKQALAVGERSVAQEAFGELPESVQRGLWVAPSKGGPFTTDERLKLRKD